MSFRAPERGERIPSIKTRKSDYVLGDTLGALPLGMTVTQPTLHNSLRRCGGPHLRTDPRKGVGEL